ncbi:hemolysin XhlA family protein [Paenibacillus sp. 481]|nr:hemolysin XhlA family protein [Paenibacillus sp. 481]
MKAVTETLVNVRVDLARLEAKVDVIRDLPHKVEAVRSIAEEALDQGKSAHHRLSETREDFKEEVNKIEDNQKWLWRTVTGACVTGTVTAIFAFFIKLKG